MVLSLWGAKNRLPIALNHLLQYFLHLISFIVDVNLVTTDQGIRAISSGFNLWYQSPTPDRKSKMVFTMNWVNNYFILVKNNAWAFYHWQVLQEDLLHPFPWSRMHCFFCKHGLCMELSINSQIFHAFPSLHSLNPISVLCLLSRNHYPWFFYHISS